MYAGNLYTDIPRGVFLVRGENVLLLGEIVRSFVSWGMAAVGIVMLTLLFDL